MALKFNPFIGAFDIDTQGAAVTANGDVVGPSSATDNAVVRFDGTSGKLVQNSSFIVNDSGEVATGSWKATDVAVADGGTGASTALSARTNLLAQNRVFYTVGTSALDDYVTDGTADDVQIQQAIDAANSAGGGVVHLKVGTFTTSAAIVMKANVILEGDGMTATIIKKVASGNFSAVAASSISNFQVRDLKIDGNKTNSALGRGLSFNTVTNAIVERVQVVDAVEGIFNTASSDVTYRDCISDSNYEWNYYTNSGTRVRIYNCQSLNAKAGSFEGFGMAFYNTCGYCEAVGNYIYNPAHNGIQINAGSATADVVGMVLRDNTVVNAGHRGIQLTNDLNTFYVKKALVAGNRVTGSTEKGINLIAVYDSVVTGNRSYSNTANDGLCYDNCINIYSVGNVSMGNNTGLRTISPTNVATADTIVSNTTNYNLASGTLEYGPDFTLDGTAVRDITVGRQSSGAGSNFTVQAGGALSGGTDLNGGNLILASGIAVGNNSSRIEMQVVPNGQGAGTTDRSPLSVLYLTATGTNNQRTRLGLGTNGVGSADGITLGGNSAYQVAMNRHTTSNTAGNSLTVKSGGATSGATDKAAGQLILSTGNSTGTGGGSILLQTPTPQGSTSTTDNTPATRLTIDSTAITAAVDVVVPDEAYGAGWDGSLEVPTKNALYDKIETISGGTVTATPDYVTSFLFMGA